MKIELEITEELGKSLKEIADGAKVEVEDMVKMALSSYVAAQIPKPKSGLFGLSLRDIAAAVIQFGRTLEQFSRQKGS